MVSHSPWIVVVPLSHSNTFPYSHNLSCAGQRMLTFTNPPRTSGATPTSDNPPPTPTNNTSGPRLEAKEDTATVTRQTTYSEFVLARFSRAFTLFNWEQDLTYESDSYSIVVSVVVRITSGANVDQWQEIAVDAGNWEAIRALLARDGEVSRQVQAFVAFALNLVGTKLGWKERVR